MIEKSEGAFRTIGELSAQFGLPQHILRYWETRFPQLKPLTRSGSRRYYRTEDVELVKRIHHLLYAEGYTIRGVQQLLAGKTASPPDVTDAPSLPITSPKDEVVSVSSLLAIRERLARALAG